MSRRPRARARDRLHQVSSPNSVTPRTPLPLARVHEIKAQEDQTTSKLTVEFLGHRSLDVDVSFLLKAPHLARPFADAFAHWGSRNVRPASIRSHAAMLRTGFFRFLAQKQITHLHITHINSALLNSFLEWLNTSFRADGRHYSAKSKQSKRSAVKAMVESLKALPQYSARLPRHVRIRANPWPGEGDLRETPEPLSLEDQQLLYNACANEVEATIARVRAGWALLEEARTLSSEPERYGLYADLARSLKAVDQLFPGMIPAQAEVVKHNKKLGKAMDKNHGYARMCEIFQPTAHSLVPFILLLGLHTGYNRDILLNLSTADIQREEVMGKPRLLFRPYKARSHSTQPQSFAVEARDDEPGAFIPFLLDWTARIRQVTAPEFSDHVFLFATSRDRRPSVFLAVHGDQRWYMVLRTFLDKHDLKHLTLRQLRVTRVEILRKTIGDTPEVARDALGHATIDTQYRHYRPRDNRERNAERLGHLSNLHARWIDTNGEADPREMTAQQQDWGARTPGFTCLDPYHSPINGEVAGRLCRTYGACPICPLAVVDLNNPVSLARLLQFKLTLIAAQNDLPPEMWLSVWAPRLHKLANHWLPAFDNPNVIGAAERLILPAIPRISSME